MGDRRRGILRDSGPTFQPFALARTTCVVLSRIRSTRILAPLWLTAIGLNCRIGGHPPTRSAGDAGRHVLEGNVRNQHLELWQFFTTFMAFQQTRSKHSGRS
jgi:hypothetical protein